jgi:hypothetical protein
LSGSSDYISLKEFSSGYGWHAKVLSYSKGRMHIFEMLTKDQAKNLAVKLGGTAEKFDLYDTTWTLSFEPLPNLKILFLLVKDEEFGSEFYVFYNKTVVDIYPAEEVIIFSIVFISLLAQEAEALWSKKQRLGAMILEKHPIDQKKINVVQQIQPDIAQQVASNLGCEFNEISGGWNITFKTTPDFPVTYEVTASGVQMKYDEDKAQWMPGVVYAFKWLYLNAIIREARKFSADLPQISFSGLI